MYPYRVYSISLLLIGLAVLLAACGSSPAGEASPPAGGPIAFDQLPKNADGYADISPAQLAALLDDKDFVMVNVHVPYEGEIEQTDLFIAYDQIAGETGQLPAPDAPIVLYCRSGSMSTTAARELAEMGYSNIAELDGGFNAWRAAGYELLQKPQ